MRTQAADALFNLFHGCGDVHAALTRRSEGVLPFDLTMPQFTVLDDLRQSTLGEIEHQVTPLMLANSQNITKGAVTNLLRQLLDKGFVTIAKHPKDGRSKLVLITKEGARAHRHSMVALSEMTSQILSEFSVDEMSIALPVLKKFAGWLDKA